MPPKNFDIPKFPTLSTPRTSKRISVSSTITAPSVVVPPTIAKAAMASNRATHKVTTKTVPTSSIRSPHLPKTISGADADKGLKAILVAEKDREDLEAVDMEQATKQSLALKKSLQEKVLQVTS